MSEGHLSNAIDMMRLQPARLDVSAPWELQQSQKDVVARAIEGEAWLGKMGLLGLVTGVANSHMPTFASSVERLAGMLRFARETGQLEARIEANNRAAAAWRPRVGYAALAALAAGVAIGALLF
jgi:hypothetical protein